MQFSSIWPINKIISNATTPGQNGTGSNGNEGVLHIPRSANIIGTSLFDCLVSYPEHSLGEVSYSSAKVQSVYSTAPADWTKCNPWLKSFQTNQVNQRKQCFLNFKI